jgi:hypothetical protein
VSRSALVIGLLFGFLWEELLPLLPGHVPQLTLIYYLRSYLSGTLMSGPLSGYPTTTPATSAVAVLLAVAVAFVLAGAAVFRYLETAPERTSA